MGIKSFAGRAFYSLIAKHLPGSYSKFNIGQRRFRNMTARCFAPGIDRSVNIEKGASFSSKVVAGKKSNIGMNAYIQGETVIGNYVMMGPECNIWTVNHMTSRTDIPMCEQGDAKEMRVVIDDDVWIGSRVTILPGVHIGKGCIIGAGAIVSKDIPDYSVAAGNPARVVKTRDRNDQDS